RHQARASRHGGEYLNRLIACQPRCVRLQRPLHCPFPRAGHDAGAPKQAWYAIIPVSPVERMFAVDATLLASDLGFPEGPVVMPNGEIVFCDGNIGELRSWKDGTLGTYAVTGGSPWGALLGSDGAIYVTQGGNVPGSGDLSAVCGIQRVTADGSVELLSSSIGGHELAGPNDLAFGPDGRLWFTDSGTEQDDRFAPEDRAPGRLFVLGSGGEGELLMERPNVYPDGMAFAADGRAFVCTTISGGVTVISPDGEVLDEINLGQHATNCIFAGSALYVTATATAEIHADERTGTFWRVETDATGLPLIPGKL